jgi:hypothetical protein
MPDVSDSLSLLVVTGRCGEVDDAGVGRTILRPPVGGQAAAGWRGLAFDLTTWDGSDLFVPRRSGYVIVTSKAKTALERSHVTNAAFTPLERVERLML